MIKIRKLTPAENTLFPELFAEPVKPVGECKVRNGPHNFITIKSYTEVKHWPESAYGEFCSYCNQKK